MILNQILPYRVLQDNSFIVLNQKLSTVRTEKNTDLSLLDYCWVRISQSVVELAPVLMADKGFHLIVDHVA